MGDPCEGCTNKDGMRCNEPGRGDLYRFNKRNFPKLPCEKFEVKVVYPIEIVGRDSFRAMFKDPGNDEMYVLILNEREYHVPAFIANEIVKSFSPGEYRPNPKDALVVECDKCLKEFVLDVKDFTKKGDEWNFWACPNCHGNAACSISYKRERTGEAIKK